MNPKKIKEILARAESLLRSDHYREALSVLDDCRADGMPANQRGYFCILRAEASLYLGSYRVGHLLDEAVEIFRSKNATALFGRAKFLKGWLHCSNGDFVTAKEVLTEAYSHYLRLKDTAGAARTLNRLAYASLKTGDMNTSLSVLNKCASLYRELEDCESEFAVLLNSCYLEWSMGRLKAARDSYKGLADLLDKASARNHLIYYEMSAIPQALSGDIESSKEILAHATPYLEAARREKAVYFENLGLIEILSGKYAVAEEALKQGLQISLDIAPESALISQIKRLFGDLYVATKEWTKAEKYATEALAVAEKINERIEIAACHRVLAQVALQRREKDRARELFTEAIDLFNLIGAQYELAVTRYLAGVSGLWSNGERMAMLYLAREYFASEDIKPYLNKADTALKSYTTPAIRSRARSDSAPEIIAVAEPTRRLVALAEHVAESGMNVLLTGETGVGKDLFANYIHHCSGRTGKFVSLNVAALPSDMIEAELFGHAKGAFTGAATERKGLIEEAADGSLYLNEIGDAPAQVQVKLLEVLETRMVRRIGENVSREVSFRLIAATNQDLQQAIKDNRFRLDLFHRLNEIPIHLPPLRERTEDVPALVEHFLRNEMPTVLSQGSGLHLRELASVMQDGYWEGNVRELRAVLLRVAFQAGGDPGRMVELAREELTRAKDEALANAMQAADGNQSEAARMLGVSEGTIRYRLNRRK